MQIRENISLKQYNTFGINVKAKYFSVFQNQDELAALVNSSKFQVQHSKLVLGGGSNILFTKDFDGFVIKNEISGIEVLEEDNEHVFVKAGGGENWHKLVLYCVENGLSGIENLSLIPGNVGASPMQNIGAYGVEVKDVFHELEAFHLQEGRLIKFSRKECEFGYRESVFKHRYKNQFVITAVTYRLKKHPDFYTSYGAIQQELENMGVEDLSIKAISQAVINIRSSKLPDPKTVGNAGSFFKNPAVNSEIYEQLKKAFPAIPSFTLNEGYVKIPAGWLIEQCGWKGYRKGDAGCYERQALVLVNLGAATGKEIYDLSEEIFQSVKIKFGIELEREVNIVP